MSWKPPKRTLQNVTKVKLGNGHPLPEDVDDVTPISEFTNFAQKHLQFQRNESAVFSEFNLESSASQMLEDVYLDRFDETYQYDQGEESDLEDILYEFGGTDESSLDNSSASFFSWTDDIGPQDSTKNKELLEELEMALYDDDLTLVKDEELVTECHEWKSAQVFLRVTGKKPFYTQEISEHFSELENESCGDVEGEILAIHGFPSESPEHKALADSGGTGSKHDITSNDSNMIEKVKAAALEQLAFYALSEALQSFEGDQLERQVAVKRNPHLVDDAASALANLSEDLGRVLQISGRSIHRSAKVINSENEKNIPIGPEHCRLGVQSKRFFSNIIPEDKICMTSNTSFPVFGIPKPLNSEIFGHKTKILEKRGYHSAADRKRPGILNRRFSCISPEHDKFLKTSQEDEECESSSSDSSNGKLISAPNTPFKLLRHLTLPPIQNLNSFKLSTNSAEKSPTSLHIKQIFAKKKVSLSPLPNAVNVPGGGMTELQLAKKLLDSTPDSGHWSSYQKPGISGIQNVKSRKKNVAKSVNDS